MAIDYFGSMGQAVAERTILRRKKNGHWEKHKDVANRVAMGNALLAPTAEEKRSEYELLKDHIGNGRLITSGRHLQHGDATQPARNIEVFGNCATAMTTFASTYLLLNGSGVGRCYDDDLMLVNWDNAPNILCTLDTSHKDFDYAYHESARDARHKYGDGDNVIWFRVPDSREGWAQAIELYETLAFEKIHRDKLLVLDFTDVRPKGSPIGGMQDRPASGPAPLMAAFNRVASLKGAGMAPWKQAMYADHYFAECVLVGGVRRSARIAVKHWKDASIFEFIEVKRPIEFKDLGVTSDGFREVKSTNPFGFLWSANNSVGVDQEFWDLLKLKGKRARSPLVKHARRVFAKLTECSYYDGTGEPGLVNQDKLTQNDLGIDKIQGDVFGSVRYEQLPGTSLYMDRLLKIAKSKTFKLIVNPCSEICLAVWGGMCIIADICYYFCDDVDQAEEVTRATVRFLIRVNQLDSVYSKEVKRTNRIGVGLTGVHEAAFKFYGFTFRDLIDEEKSQVWWNFINRMRRAAEDEAYTYSKKLGMPMPHTVTTVKPSGSVSKLFGLTEGWHLPAMKSYLRWVQFSSDAPLVKKYRNAGYPIKELKTYKNTVVVGFPTQPLIAQIMPDRMIVTAPEATPEEQYKWLMLGEKYWLGPDRGNQISYTLKYDPKVVSYEEFRDTLLKYQSQIRCCSVMPANDGSSYEYLPEEPVSQAVYNDIVSQLRELVDEDVSREHVDCGAGGCPVDFNSGKK
jgi:adenosylcobalamin-dependent ribonucleoside-triphosphate reductase